MTVSKRMDTDEFKRLADEEFGAEIVASTLKPVPFIPPRKGDLDPVDPYEKDGMTVIMLNVLEPQFFKDPRDNEIIIVLPKTQDDKFDYDYFAEIHPKGNKPWGYRLSPKGWDPTDSAWDLGDVAWYYQSDDTELPKFELGKVATH